MIKNKKLLYLAFIPYIISMALNFPFPHERPYGETLLEIFNIPIRSANGFHIMGILSLALLFASFFLLVRSIAKYQGRMVLLAILVAVFAPSMLANAYQQTFADGIYAVSYDREWSNCRFEMIGESTLRGECDLPFENYNSNDVQFTLEFNESFYFEDDIKMESLLNISGPHTVELAGHERKVEKVYAEIDVTEIENHVDSGTSSGVSIVIKSGENMRRL
ncbi:hypothetical protein [Bacillus mesophilum]|uniref:Uncharacterized protein n=1 Tax=Bacillus mesophilum TaxID=1071718 RepID=A0A7V7RKR9_9BACI|nr:hypothetical protein [Bacillus mesophilum]KAB2331944.1 hypothetical protein F7732_14890 [Bacillus mesophilum]